MELRALIVIFVILASHTTWAFFPFLRCDGLGDSNVSPSYCRVCFATSSSTNSRLCSQAYFNQSPDVQLLTQNLEDDFGYNLNKLKRVPEEGLSALERRSESKNACLNTLTQLQFIERQIEFLKAQRDSLMAEMQAKSCSPQKSLSQPSQRLPASDQDKN